MEFCILQVSGRGSQSLTTTENIAVQIKWKRDSKVELWSAE